jgi:hypothetical protein
MQTPRWWLRIVGAFCVLEFELNAFVHAPISIVGRKIRQSWRQPEIR